MTIEAMWWYGLAAFLVGSYVLAFLTWLPDIREARRLGIPLSELYYYKACHESGWRYRTHTERDADLEAALKFGRTADERRIRRNYAYKKRLRAPQRVKTRLLRLGLS